MSSTWKRLLSLLLCAVMAAGMLPANAMAEVVSTIEVPAIRTDVPAEDAVITAEELTEATENSTVTAEGTCGDNLAWVLDENGTLTISGTGAMESYTSTSDAPWDSYREDIASVVVEDGVTSISYRAFYNCTALATVNLPEGLTALGDFIFSSSTALTEVWFHGDAPETINEYALGSITAMVYYPAGNSAWTNVITGQYGGTITWKANGTEMKITKQPVDFVGKHRAGKVKNMDSYPPEVYSGG